MELALTVLVWVIVAIFSFGVLAWLAQFLLAIFIFKKTKDEIEKDDFFKGGKF